MNGSWGVWHYVGAFRHTQGWRLHRDAFGISMEQPSHGSQTSDDGDGAEWWSLTIGLAKSRSFRRKSR